jgi:hypothetical protein
VLIIGDSHVRLSAANVKSEINVGYDVQRLVKPGAGTGTLVNSAISDIANLTKKMSFSVEVLTTLLKTTLIWP